MTSRIATALVLSAAGLGLAACGSDDARRTSDSPMQRCETGRTLTVTDPVGDGRAATAASAKRRRAVAADPDAFDLRRVALKTGDGTLCVSVTFAGDDPSGQRRIGLNVAPARPQLDPDSPLARLDYGGTANVANFAPFGAIEAEPISGVTTSGGRGRVVELAVALDQLLGVANRVDLLDGRSLSWRVGTASDCTPARRRLIGYPGGRTRALPDSPAHAVNIAAPAGCTGG